MFALTASTSSKSLVSRLGDLFRAHKEAYLGDDFWIPSDDNEVTGFPSYLLPAHQQILPSKSGKSDNPFTVVQGSYENRPGEIWYHVTFSWLLDDKQKTMSLARSQDLQFATDLYESCLNCQQVFVVLDKETDLKKGVTTLLKMIRAHPLWLDVHIAASLGTVEYFKQKAEESKDKLNILLNTACQPEGSYPLQLAILAKQLEMVVVLLDLGADVAKADVCGENAMHYAAKTSGQVFDLLTTSQPECLKLLNSLNNEGYTPLSVAIRNVSATAIASLVHLGAALNVVCKGRSPLMEVMQQTSTDIKAVTKTLLEGSPDLLTEVDEQTGNSPLHMAVSKAPLSGLLMAAGSKLDLNVRNNTGQTSLHVHTYRGNLGCVITLAAYGADLDAQDQDGNSPLHIAVFKGLVDVIKALLVTGADTNLSNNNGDTARHLAAKQRNNEIIRCLEICGSERCAPGKIGCSSGCADLKSREVIQSPSDTGINEIIKSQEKSSHEFIIEKKRQMSIENMQKLLSTEQSDGTKYIGLLSLDGGGIRGLVIIQILLALEKALGDKIWNYFDWTAGTSTGSFVCAGLALGKTIKECQGIYLRFKDQLFEGGARPYNTTQLEEFIQKEMGGKTTLADIPYPRINITTALAEKHPIQLKLFCNYALPGDKNQSEQYGYTKPKDQLLWRALRCSSAAPTYFASVDGKYVDGGVMANNPTLDLLSEIDNWNSTIDCLNLDSKEKVTVGFVLSVGTGRVPDIPIENIDFDSSKTPFKIGAALQNLGYMLMDQATSAEGISVERARSWCQSLGAPFFRFSTPMTKDYKLDSTDDSDVVAMMWESQEYVYEKRKEMNLLCEVMKLIGPNTNRR